MTKKSLSMFLCMALLCAQLHAQNRVISGKVTDAAGNPIPNASVMIKGTKIGTTTGADGSYSITLPPAGAKALVISSVGQAPQELTIGAGNTLSTSLKASEKDLDEVVVVAYGTAKKESFTGSASKITAKDIAPRPLTNVATALTGSAPGIQTTSPTGQPGSTPAVRIRGFGSVSGANDPLYVVDGVPFNANLANINMDDVENITVLKDAATTSLYGSRAANGVVMITTKRGRKGRMQVNFKYNHSITTRAIQEYEKVNAEEYYPLMWEAYRNSLVYRTSNPQSIAQASQIASGLVPGQNGIKNLLAYNPFNVADNAIVLPDGTLNPSARLMYRREDLDWFGPVSRNGNRNEYSVNMSGASDKSDYFVSFAYLKDKSYINRSDLQRFNARVNLNSQVTSWLKTGFNMAFANTESNLASTDDGAAIVNPFLAARRTGPIYPVYAYDTALARRDQYLLDANGNRQYDFGNATLAGLPIRPSGAYPGRHTIAENELSREVFRRNVFNGRGYLEFKLMDNLKFTTNLSADVTNRTDNTFQNPIIGDGAPSGRGSKTMQTIFTYNFNQLLNYNKRFGNHGVDVLLGHEAYKENYDELTGTRQGVIVANNLELINFTTTTNLNSAEDNYAVEGYFARANYDYDNKYFLSVSGRRDGSSRWRDEVRWGNFWSVSAGWLISRENFMKNASWVDNLKLRSSYGTAGNDNVGTFYAYQTFYNLGINNGTIPGIWQGQVGNPNITWENNKQFDVGLEFALLKSRLTGSIEYYNRVSDDLLFTVPTPLSAGVPGNGILDNVGSMYNRGFEFSLTGDIIRKKDLNWYMTLNLTTLTNRITKLPQPEIISGTKKLMVGKSLYDYWLRDWYGVDPADGAGLYRANITTGSDVRIINKTDTVTTSPNNAKFAYVGSAIPDFYGSIITGFNYKGFDFSILANFQVGGLVYDGAYAQLMEAGSYGASLSKDMLNRWQKAGDITSVPRMDAGQLANFGSQSDRWLTDATSLNLRNITVGYTLSKNVLNKVRLSNARFYVSVENVQTFTARQGMNVEQSFTGVTSNGFIPARVFNLGVNVNF